MLSTSRFALKSARRMVAPAVGATRGLKVHEYVSMNIMQKFNIKTPECYMAQTPTDAEKAFTKLNKDAVIKAQVLSGGRGRGTFENGFKGGVHLVDKPSDAKEYAAQMLGQKLMTKQVPNGILCNKVLLMERLNVKREMYLSIILDRGVQGPLIVACASGGMSIEDVAKTNPELIFKEPVDMTLGIQEEQCTRLATNLGFEPGTDAHAQCAEFIKNLYKLFDECDCTLAEINPIAETKEGNVVACDAKLVFDDRTKRRHPEIFEQRDVTQEDQREVFASKFGFNYVGLGGSIGCMVNGAGLAMATMDLMKLKGGDPACFLDVGGAADESQIEGAFELLHMDEQVKSISVNIFGGIVRCDLIASGILKAVKKLNVEEPIIVRFEGNRMKEGKQLLIDSGYKNFYFVDDWEEAAQKAVDMAAQNSA